MESRRNWSRRLRRMADAAGVVDHKFFTQLESGPERRTLLSLWAIQDYFVSRRFPCLIGSIVSHIDDPVARHPMIENLWEEHGEGALSGTHYTLYCDLLESIDLPRDPLLSSANAETIEFIEKQEQLAKQDVFGGLGAFCYANEYLTIAEFGPIWHAIEDEFPAANVRFFEENVRVDSRHARQTEDVIERLADSDRDLMAVERGAKEALAARSRFYDALMSK